MSKYLLDANVFIEAKNTYYRFETFPVFWDWLDQEHENGNLATTVMVRDEVLKGNDELAEWIRDRKATDWFLPVDDEPTQEELIEINDWIMGQPYKDIAKEGFLDGADTWLIAKAKTSGATVVTQEKSNPQSKRKVFIPDVCNQFRVPNMDTFKLMEQLGASFGL